MISGLSHVCFSVMDLDAAVAFYTGARMLRSLARSTPNFRSSSPVVRVRSGRP
jgi:catechol 2,3-dioxygenase-like lactoylglutathione lyase family enzyme